MYFIVLKQSSFIYFFHFIAITDRDIINFYLDIFQEDYQFFV